MENAGERPEDLDALVAGSAPHDVVDERLSERGQGMVEYGLILVLIAVVVIVMVQVLGHQTSNLFSNVSNGLNA